MVDHRFKNLRLLLCVAKLALIEAEEHARDVRLLLHINPELRLWGIALEGYYPKEAAQPVLHYEMTFTIQVDDLKIQDHDPQAAFLKRLVMKDGGSMAESKRALLELRNVPILTIDPANPPSPEEGVHSHQTVRVG